MENPQYICTNPECADKNKSFKTGGTMTTLMGWFPRWDEHGRPLNTDPNRRTTPYTCECCKREYVKEERGWTVRFFFDGREVLERDDTPDYVKEFNKQQS